MAALGLMPGWAPAALYDAESGLGTWTASGLWHIADSTCAGTRSGSAIYYFGLDGACNYDNGQAKDASLTSPILNISSPSNALLSFWTQWQVESLGPSCYDQLWLERQDQSNGVWVKTLDLGPSSDPSGASLSLGYASGTGLGGVPQWEFKVIDLSPFIGSSYRFRFRFLSSAGTQANEDCPPPDAVSDSFLGWALDDICLGCVAAPVTLAKSANKSFAAPGETVTFTLVAKNWGATADDVTVIDTLPAWVNYVDAVPVMTQLGQTLSVLLPSLGSGASATVSLRVAIDAATPLPIDWFNTATSWGLSGAAFESAPVWVRARGAGMNITKSAQPGALTSGDLVTYVISVSNFSPSLASSVTVQEFLPSGFVPAAAFPPFSLGQIWGLGDMVPGETRILTVLGYLNGFDGQIAVNTVQLRQNSSLIGSADAPVKISRPASPQMSIVTIYPNPAPSDKAGLPQSAFIVYDTNEALDVNLDVFNVAGERVRLLTQKATRGRNQIEWNLKNDAERDVATGVYLIRLTAHFENLILEAVSYVAVSK